MGSSVTILRSNVCGRHPSVTRNEQAHSGLFALRYICISWKTHHGLSYNSLRQGEAYMRQAINWTIAWILLVGTLGTNLSEIFIIRMG